MATEMFTTTPEQKPVTINKIGGASMSKKEELLSLVKYLDDSKEAPIFVVSAFKDITDRLYSFMDSLSAILKNREITQADIEKALVPVQELTDKNLASYFPKDADPKYRKAVDEFIASQKALLSAQLLTHQKITRILAPQIDTFKVRDNIIALGENVAACAMQELLRLHGYHAAMIRDVHCAEQYGVDENVPIHKVHESIQDGVAKAVESQIQDIRQQIIIVGGHIAGTPRGMTEDIGRSYTDVTAVDVAAALKRLPNQQRQNASVRFWKAEKGILSTDPRIFSEVQKERVKKHDRMSQGEMREVASTGNTLLHAQALALAHAEQIDRLELRNIEDPKDPGTTFIESDITTGKRFKCITCNERMAMVTVEAGQMANIEGFMKGVAQLFAEAGISLDTITTQGTSIDVTVILPRDKSQSDVMMAAIVNLEPRLRDLNTGKHTYRTDRVIFRECARESISLIGTELKEDAAETVAEAIQLLKAEKIKVTSFVAAENPCRVTLHVKGGQGKKAVDILHRHFLENGSK